MKNHGHPLQPENIEPPKLGNLAYWRERYLSHLQALNYRPSTVTSHFYCLRLFLEWAHQRELNDPKQITRSILESYRRHLYHWRKKNNKPLGITTQRKRLESLKTFFRWLSKERVLEANPASELEMPRSERALPQDIFSLKEIYTIMAQPDTRDLLGIRDRALLETLYSTGIRRGELVHLELSDINIDKKVLSIRHTKTRRDRFVPLGKNALIWIEKYLSEVRPRLLIKTSQPTLFLTLQGERFHLQAFGRLVINYVKKAGIKKPGGCHLIRHTCATHMLENGADIRYIQQLLGHTDLKSTAIYTEVSIKTLQAIHAKTHPGG